MDDVAPVRSALRIALEAAEPPALVAASSAPLARPAYALRFGLAGPPGAVLLQRVETTVRLTRGDEPVLEYRAVEWEWFELAPVAEPRTDVHDFDARRDGWAPAAVAALLRAHGRRSPGGPARLEVTKRFRLGPGQLEAAVPAHRTAGGGAFGLLAEGEGEPSRVVLLVGPGRLDASAEARPRARAGQGRFVGAPLLAADERLVWEPATLAGQVERQGYHELLDSAPAC